MAGLKDRVWFIAGVTGGIGKRTAEIFAAGGAKPLIAGRLRRQEGLGGMQRASGIES